MIYFLVDLAHGRGHIERCKALASIMADYGIQFSYTTEAPSQGIPWPERFFGAHFTPNDIIVLDLPPQAYTELICANLIAAVTSTHCGIVALDGGDTPECIALLLDLNFMPWEKYGVDHPRSRVGFEWVILRPELVSWKNLLGTYEDNDIFVYGGGNDHLHLKEQVSGLGYKLLEGTNFPPLMAQARLGVTRFGITTYELLCMGVPQVCTTDNEGDFEILERLDHDGVLVWCRDHRDVAKSLLELERCDLPLMSEKAQQLIDGYGVWRVRDEILKWV